MVIEEEEIPPLPTDLGPPLAPETSDDHVPVFLVSDLHIGSNARYRITQNYVVDKKRSNWFPPPEPRRFLTWLHWIARVAQKIAPDRPYDIVMVGDFLDLWQADIPPGHRDSYNIRIDDIVGTNMAFFKGFTAFLRTNPRARFHYVIGNHDDPFYKGDATEDPLFGLPVAPGVTYDKSSYDYARLRNNFLNYMNDLAGAALPNLTISKRYMNRTFRLYAEHGHKNDTRNLRGSNYSGHKGPPPGQKLVETGVNPLSEFPGPPRTIPPATTASPSYPFEGLGTMSPSEVLDFFKCIDDQGHIDDDFKAAIDEFRRNGAKALGLPAAANSDLWEPVVDWYTRGSTDPDKTRQSNYDYIKRKMVSEGGAWQVCVMGHTHLFDWRETNDEIYANSDTWIPKYKLNRRTVGTQTICEIVPQTQGPRHPFLIARWKPDQAGSGVSSIRGKVVVTYHMFTPNVIELERGEVNIRV